MKTMAIILTLATLALAGCAGQVDEPSTPTLVLFSAPPDSGHDAQPVVQDAGPFGASCAPTRYTEMATENGCQDGLTCYSGKGSRWTGRCVSRYVDGFAACDALRGVWVCPMGADCDAEEMLCVPPSTVASQQASG